MKPLSLTLKMFSLTLHMLTDKFLLRWVVNSPEHVLASFIMVINTSGTNSFKEGEDLLAVLDTLG